MHIPGSTVQDIHIHRFPHGFLIHRTVSIGHDKAVSRFRGFKGFTGNVPLKVLFLRPGNTPHLQEHHGHALHRIPPDHYSRILPVPEPLFYINILIRQIDPAGESDFSVNNQYFPVIPVVIMGG